MRARVTLSRRRVYVLRIRVCICIYTHIRIFIYICIYVKKRVGVKSAGMNEGRDEGVY